MQAEMTFYMTKHFIEQNTFDADMLQQMIPNAYVIKSRRPMGYTGSLQQAADEVGNKIYGYYRTRKHKCVIVLGKNTRSGQFDVLVTIYSLNNQGWAAKAFSRIPRRKRRTLSQHLKFKRAVLVIDPEETKQPNQPIKHHVLSVHEWGLNVGRKE